jgi:error-prone DNA polymerase
VRTRAPVDALEVLATAGAFGCFDVERRAALWAAGALADVTPVRTGPVLAAKLPGVVTGVDAPPLPGMTDVEETAADLRATGMSPARHPSELVRAELERQGIATAEALRELPDRSVVEVAGIVTHRQRPETAKGVTFVNLEDETGLVNVICPPAVWKRYRKVARDAPALRIRGMLERRQGVTNVLAHRIAALPLGVAELIHSRDFR